MITQEKIYSSLLLRITYWDFPDLEYSSLDLSIFIFHIRFTTHRGEYLPLLKIEFGIGL